MLVPNVLEPMNLSSIFKQTQSNTMDGSITPAFVEEATGAIEMVEVFLVGRRAPEVHVRNLKVTPEVAGAVAICLDVVVWSAVLVGQPFHGVVGMLVMAVCSQEFDSLGPQCCDGLGRVVEVDGKAVSLVAVLHEAEDVVVDVTEEVDFWLDAPVVLHVLESGVVVEQARVPAAHLVVAQHVRVLNVMFLEDICALTEQIAVDPTWHFPVLFWNELVAYFGLCHGTCGLFEVLGEGYVVEEGPGVVEFVVPSTL